MILSIYRYTTQGKVISLAIDCLGAENMTQPKVRGLRSEAVFGLADFRRKYCLKWVFKATYVMFSNTLI